jgi:membrane associated rhomboid family serine protease
VFVILTALFYAAYVFIREARPFLAAHMAVGPGIFQGEVWQPLTALFVHFDLLGFVFNLIGLWFVGATIERTQGTRRFASLFLLSGVLCNVAIAGVSHLRVYRAGDVFEGSSYAVLALFVAFGRIYDRTPAQILGGLFLQARHIAAIFVAWSALVALGRGDWAMLAATIVASAVGYFGAGPGGFSGIWDAFKLRRLRHRYQVIDGGAPRVPRKKYWN